jgi:hypothetical protein
MIRQREKNAASGAGAANLCALILKHRAASAKGKSEWPEYTAQAEIVSHMLRGASRAEATRLAARNWSELGNLDQIFTRARLYLQGFEIVPGNWTEALHNRWAKAPESSRHKTVYYHQYLLIKAIEIDCRSFSESFRILKSLYGLGFTEVVRLLDDVVELWEITGNH